MNAQPAALLNDLPPYQGSQRMVTRRQDTFDIIREIMRKHTACIKDYDAIAKKFWDGSSRGTAENIYWFAKKHLPYKVEPTLQQTVKTPGAILEERHTHGNDCKHYALFIVGVGEALRRAGYPIKCFYRFASYNPKSKTPGHVFAVFVDQGKEIWIDPVPDIGGFDRRAVSPTFYKDKMPPMSKNGSRIGSLYDISGVGEYALYNGDHALNGLEPTAILNGHKRRHWLDELSPVRQLQQVEKFARKHHLPMPPGRMPMPPGMNGTEMGKAKKKKGLHLKIKAPHIKIQPGKLLAKVAGAPSRNAFLLLLKLDAFHFGINMWKKAAHDKNSAGWKKLSALWSKLGGNTTNLYNAIKQGVGTYNKLHSAKKKVSGMYGDMEGDDMGIVQVAGAAVIAAAAPIIAALAGLMKSLGIHKEVDDAKAGADDAVKKLGKKHNKAGDDGTANEDGSVTHDDGITTDVQNNADGTQSLMIKGNPAGDQGEGGPEPDATPDNTGLPDKGSEQTGDQSTPGSFSSFLATVEDWISSHKSYVIGGTVILAAVIIIPKIVNRKPTRRRR
jgi:hypothetical protein